MEPLLIEGQSGDTYYVGDLDAGQALAHEDRYVVVRPRPKDDGWTVFLLDQPHTMKEIESSLAANLWPEDTAEFGHGETKEEAWRYALGAMFGPIDSEYDEDALRRALTAQQEGRGRA